MVAKGVWHKINCHECGKEMDVPDYLFRVGKGKYCSRSCGNKATSRTHGHTTKSGQSQTYNSWAQMRARCNNPKNPKYYLYGERGISVCERWSKFSAFLEDMGERPKGHTLDRIDGSKDYEPSNCRWATPRQQSANIRTNKVIKYKGRDYIVPELARKLDVDVGTLRYRIRNWPEEHWARPASGKPLEA